ncbi:helix-turn-helix domain-containing protein [Acerihabitans arboris]|uniref:DNA-binding protein n=1 Tax=Acerihabitans arboris TaxID=2691583 RepID=A0A845SMR5_9GAMM|nr:helix-turn-helix domain-containing protein [Acerihabitans arboris]NDL63858.1 hypothetical protein [Acerihabitans arboris]
MHTSNLKTCPETGNTHGEWHATTAGRLAKLMQSYLCALDNNEQAFKGLLSLPDDEFAIEFITQAITARHSQQESPETARLLKRAKNRADFLNELVKLGGTVKSSEVARILGVSPVTVNNNRKNGKLLAIQLGGDYLFPMFQFAKNGQHNDKGMLKGVGEILGSLDHLSDIRRCGFFMGRIDTLDACLEMQTTPLTILEKGATDEEIRQLCRIAKLRGMQDAE